MDINAKELLDSLIKRSKENGKVKSIYFELGELSHYNPEEIISYVESNTGWKVILDIKPSVIRCKCGYSGSPLIPDDRSGKKLAVCPECSSLPKYVEGKELRVNKVEYQ